MFYQNITSLAPRARPAAHGMQELSHNISSAPLQEPSFCACCDGQSVTAPTVDLWLRQ